MLDLIDRDKESPQLFEDGLTPPRELPANFSTAIFDVVGKGYLRPFELATLRLLNMIDILGDWAGLKPGNEDLLLTRGGTLVSIHM